MINWLVYLAIGKLLIWLIQTNGLTKPLFDLHPKLVELRNCDLCLGWWVYLALGLWLINLGFEQIIIAAISSFIVHIFSLGWQAKFGIVVIE